MLIISVANDNNTYGECNSGQSLAVTKLQSDDFSGLSIKKEEWFNELEA